MKKDIDRKWVWLIGALLVSLLLILLSRHEIARYLMEEYWLDIGRLEDYSEAEDAYQTHFAKKQA